MCAGYLAPTVKHQQVRDSIGDETLSFRHLKMDARYSPRARTKIFCPYFSVHHQSFPKLKIPSPLKIVGGIYKNFRLAEVMVGAVWPCKLQSWIANELHFLCQSICSLFIVLGIYNFLLSFPLCLLGTFTHFAPDSLRTYASLA